MKNLYKDIKCKKQTICVWGTGYIGLSTLGFFSKNKVKTVGYDINENLIKNLSRGKIIDQDFKKWLGFKIKPLIQKKYLKFTSKIDTIKKINPKVHFICVPTEKKGNPYNNNLLNVIKNIKKISKQCLIIVESTLTPGTSDDLVLSLIKKKLDSKEYLYAVAPRRDWFVDNSKNLENMDRVFGGYNNESRLLTEKILKIVCKNLHVASSHRVSEMVKSFENAYRHTDIALANQLSLAYPKDNIREVLKLVGTKWNIGTFYPGFGSGGYCIPLSSKYVLLGSKLKKKLSILKETIKVDKNINKMIARSLSKKKCKSIGVLGLSYKSNLKVSTLSPIIPFCEELKKLNINFKIFDPYYNKSEIKKIVNSDTFSIFKELGKFDCIVYHVNHNFFKRNKSTILKNIKCKIFFDNTGEFKNNKKLFDKKKITYKSSGDSNWI